MSTKQEINFFWCTLYPKMSYPEVLDAIVFDYLINNFHSKTAICLLNDIKSISSETASNSLSLRYSIHLETLERRFQINQFVKNGQILQALKCIHSWLPTFVSECKPLYFRLQCQHFIELLRQHQMHEALLFAQDKLANTAKENQKMMQILQVI